MFLKKKDQTCAIRRARSRDLLTAAVHVIDKSIYSRVDYFGVTENKLYSQFIADVENDVYVLD
jgi:hypothetical protein